jgi:hypothetical protein
MKRSFILDQIDELPLFLFLIYMSVWSCLPYSEAELKTLVAQQPLVVNSCYSTSGEDQITRPNIILGPRTVAHEVFGRNACVTLTFPRGSMTVVAHNDATMVIRVGTPVVDVTYGTAYVLVREGFLPLDRRIALSTRLKTDLIAQCDAEAREMGHWRVEAFIHDLSPKTTVILKLPPTNWCETGPVA